MLLLIFCGLVAALSIVLFFQTRHSFDIYLRRNIPHLPTPTLQSRTTNETYAYAVSSPQLLHLPTALQLAIIFFTYPTSASRPYIVSPIPYPDIHTRTAEFLSFVIWSCCEVAVFFNAHKQSPSVTYSNRSSLCLFGDIGVICPAVDNTLLRHRLAAQEEESMNQSSLKGHAPSGL